MLNKLRLWALLLLLPLWSAGIAADPQSKSYSTWQLDSESLRGSFTIAAREVTRLPAYQNNPDLGQLLLTHLATSISLQTKGRSCQRQPQRLERAQPGYLRVAMEWRCMANADATGPQLDDTPQLTIASLQEAAPSHIHFARFKTVGGATFEQLYTRRQPSHPLPMLTQHGTVETVASNGPDTFRTYVTFGIEHILIGLDHIAFLLTLLLLAQRLRDVLYIVTGFTLGHSITLSLSVLGYVTPDLMVVEALIGFTIAMVAIENVVAGSGQNRRAAHLLAVLLLTLVALGMVNDWRAPALGLAGLALFCWCYLMLSESTSRARKLRPLVTILFGLIHGFGFASVLQEVGLPRETIVPALLGFNIGVEIGQLVIVLILSGLGVLCLRVLRTPRPAIWMLANSALCGLGTYWFVQRLYF